MSPFIIHDRECQDAHEKSFTDAELAAEAYRQMVRAVSQAGMTTLTSGEIVPTDATCFGPNTEATTQLGVIKRFATHPHYFEDNA